MDATPRVRASLGGHYFTERNGTERNGSVTLFRGTEPLTLAQQLQSNDSEIDV